MIYFVVTTGVMVLKLTKTVTQTNSSRRGNPYPIVRHPTSSRGSVSLPHINNSLLVAANLPLCIKFMLRECELSDKCSSGAICLRHLLKYIV